MYFPGLGIKTQIARGPRIRAIGWLAMQHPFPIGDSAENFVATLREICSHWGGCVDALRWAVAGGFHTCEFCGRFRASGNIAVPASDVLFVAPEMVVHYVEHHKYLPPKDFVDAVFSCPLPGTPEYRDALKAFLPDLD